MTIGIPGWLVGPNSFGVTVSYLNYLRETFNLPDIMILFPETPLITDLDLLVLPGGSDINPARYGAIPSFSTDKPDTFKEYFDTMILPEYIASKTPIFGICRGLQTICIHFGAELLQDMYHETNSVENPYEAVHELAIAPFNKNQNRKIKVNSRHHQSVKMPGNDSLIEVVAMHAKYPQHVEAIKIKGYPIVAVQYHCEDLYESSGIKYTQELLNYVLKFKDEKVKSDSDSKE
jgi:gamma-glutamyl-gamma-aminobutyrate hydrolase PuuD